jgi:capsular exopolysaccharide synthesis family protein
MSRIHEALKRAEEEKTAMGRVEAVAPRPASLPEIEPSSARVNATETAVSLASSGFALEALTFEGLAERCPQPEWNPDTKTMLFFRKDSHQYDAEIFRTLRSRLYRARDNGSLRKLLVTSTLPGEGKSFIAANLAQVIAQQHGRRALLVDADLRAPRLHTVLGAPQTPGLAEFLRGDADETTAIQKGPHNDLFCLPSGNLPENPVELISNGRLSRLLDRMASIFDWVIVDSPPMVPVSDASLLANLCDGVLLVVKAAATPFDLAQKARAEFGDTPVVGVVLNGVRRGSGYGAEYYSYYGYPSEKHKR